MLIGKRVLYYGGHLLLFCSDPAEAQKVINKVAAEKVFLIYPLKARKRGVKSAILRGTNVLHYGPVGGGVYSRKRPYKSVGIYSRKESVS